MKVLRYVAICAIFGVLNAQSVNISDFYYRDFLDFGQGKGDFSNGIAKKDGTNFTIPQAPNFSASSNYGSLTSVGRGFAVTANHVSSPESISDLRKWGLTGYNIADKYGGSGVSTPYGRDTKFLRFDKYVVEGQVGMLDIGNTTSQKTDNKIQEAQNINQFKSELERFKDSDGNIYLYQAGSGGVTLRGTDNPQKFDTNDSGELKGGGFGYTNIDNMTQENSYFNLVRGYAPGDSRGITFYYNSNGDFNNRITNGDSGSGIYAYDSTNQKWVLLGVVSRVTDGQNSSEVSFVSNKDFEDYQKHFEQNINLKLSDNQTTTWTLSNSELKNEVRGDIPQVSYAISNNNKDLIFSGGGDIKVTSDIYRNISGLAGGFVFESATSQTTYKFTNANGGNYFFQGSGLDIGENVLVEWALGTKKDDSLHKIGKGELKITDSTGENGTLKLGEGKVTLDSSKKAFENIYITSGRGELALVKDKAEALGATKNDSNNMNILKQDSANDMGFYFGSGGGKLDLGGNNLRVNTIAANDSGAIITNSDSNKATLRIQGFGYDENGKRQTDKKADTMIHASIGESTATNGTNIDIVYKSDDNTKNADAHLIFDGHINTSGSLSTENSNIALQGHATTHATISSESIRNQIKDAENGTQKGMPDYMDLSKPSTINQPDWDNRTFKFGNGIDLKSSNLTLGRNAYLESDITSDSTSKITFGGNVKHFIDNFDGKNVTGSGFSYQQKVYGDSLNAEMQKIANQTIHYKGKITANGGSIESHILDFNASLDLKNGAKLTADYLTLTSNDSVKLSNGASATIQNLVLKNVNDLNGKFTLDSNNGTKFEVQKSFYFDNSNFDLSNLDSVVGLSVAQNYDIVGVKSTIIGTNQKLTANVSLYDEASLTLQNLTLKNFDTNSSDSNQTDKKIPNPNSLKKSVYLQGETNQTNATKLTLTESLKAENLEKAQIILVGKSEISAPKIAFSNVEYGLLVLDKDSKLTGANGSNANVEVSGADSKLQIDILGDKNFDINAQNGSEITLGLLESSLSQESSANFSGKITASNSSTIDTTALENITASVDLKDGATLNAKYANILLQDTYNSISLGANATLTAQTITAKNLSQLTLNADDSANVDIKQFIFDGGTTNLTGNLIGSNIELKNASIVKAGDLEFKKDANLTLDETSKLEVANLKVTSANLTLNFADSSANTANLQNISLENNANLTIDSWDFGNKTNFTSTDNSRVNFMNATYGQNGTAQKISADSTISGALSLLNVGKAQDSQNTDSTNQSKLTFATLEFSKKLAFSENAKIEVKFSDSVKKENITLREYYTLLSADSIFGNRVNERMKFEFCQGCETLFVVSKFDETGKNLQIKFLQSAPNTFNELNEALADYKNSARYSEILEALTQANPKDDAIDIATRTDDYSVLDKRIKRIDSDLNQIAQGNKTRQTRNLLFSNDQTINTRISQVRLAQRSEKHLRFAQNDAMYKIQTLMQGAVRSDAMPSYAQKREADLQNSVWLNVGGGYFGGDSKMGFGATNIGYDRLFDAQNGSVLVGAMLGFGGSKAHTGALSENALFYNIGLYLHSLFGERREGNGGHEIQGNLSFSISDNRKSIESYSAKNTAFGTLFALYYKYNFIVAQNEAISHAIKPVVLVSVGYNRNGAFENLGEYTQKSYDSVNLSYGLGVEYNAVMSASFYSLALTLKDMAWSSEKNARLSLNGARNFIGYSVESAPRFSVELNIVGSHKITPAFYIQYGIAGMIDSGANYGAKGDIKLGYKF